MFFILTREIKLLIFVQFFGTESVVVICSEFNPFSESDNGICKATFGRFMIPVPGDLLYKV